jgi:hypothetical protein
VRPPIVAIAETRPSEIVAYLSDRHAVDPRPGDEVQVAAVRNPYRIGSTRVVSVHPTVERLPERLWMTANAPTWGRPVVLEAPAGLELLPGEVVRGWWR